MRLQRGQWADAARDLEQALALETEQVGEEDANALVRNNLGNCKGECNSDQCQCVWRESNGGGDNGWTEVLDGSSTTR
jgi:hypothetical protein